MPEPSIPPTPEFLIQLRRTYQATRVRLDAELSATGLTTPQYIVLGGLEQEGELSSSELARRSLVTAQTMDVLVKGLEAAGLVARRRHPGHGRILLVSLTSSGRAALRRGLEVALQVQAEVLRPLCPDDQRRLVRHLQAVEDATSRREPWPAAPDRRRLDGDPTPC
jgi:DNA-binding MarR family transcriptional regulator